MTLRERVYHNYKNYWDVIEIRKQKRRAENISKLREETIILMGRPITVYSGDVAPKRFRIYRKKNGTCRMKEIPFITNKII